MHNYCDEVMTLFMNYNWPGNVRELKNVLEGAVSLSAGPVLTIKDLPPHFREKINKCSLVDAKNIELVTEKIPGAQTARNLQHVVSNPLNKVIGDTERNIILNVLGTVNGNKRQAAKMLGISRSSFYNKLKRYDLT